MLGNTEIKSIVGDAIKSASDNNTTLEAERVETLKRYNGEKYGDEVDGKSSVTTTEFRDAVEWALSQMLEVYFGGEKTVELAPRKEADVDAAKMATDHVDYILHTENNSYVVFSQWLKDALMYKIGVVKAYHEESTKKDLPQSMPGLQEDEFIMVTQDETLEILEHTENEIEQEYVDAMGEVVVAVITTHDLTVREIIDDSGIRIAPVPLDEFIVSSDAKFCSRTGGVDASLIGHRRKYTQSELIAMGFDKEKVEALKNADDTTLESDERNRFTNHSNQNEDTIDPSTREVWIVEAFMNIDRDQDGVAELCRVIVGDFNGDGEILEIKEWDMQPMAVITPSLMQHVLYGTSYFDLMAEVQKVKTVLTRQTLDNVYHSNNNCIIRPQPEHPLFLW